MRKLFLLLLLVPAGAFAQSRIASDFEIAQMKEQLATRRDFLSQLSGRLNLGDAHLARNEPAVARAEYERALQLAAAERVNSRRESDLTGYATATSYAALAHARLGQPREAFALLEESIRFSSDSAKSWNLYASAMSVLRQPRKAAGAARNAVAIASRDAATSPSIANRLDLAIYQYALASALIETGTTAEAEELLRTSAESLRSQEFEPLRRDVARRESFEIHSTARGEGAAYLSILNRTQLRLASLLEKKGDVDGARVQYERVLEMRTDDATALSALARLTQGRSREQYFVSAFDANPFAPVLIREYRNHIAHNAPPEPEGASAGAVMRRALVQMQRGENRAARVTLDALLQQFPDNESLRALRRETEAVATPPPFLDAPSGQIALDASEAQLHQLLRSFPALSPQQRGALDAMTFSSVVRFDVVAEAAAQSGQTIFHSGTIGKLRFRFAQPTAFAGTFATNQPLRLTYRILGPTEVQRVDGLLVEPLAIGVTP